MGEKGKQLYGRLFNSRHCAVRSYFSSKLRQHDFLSQFRDGDIQGSKMLIFPARS